MTPKEAMNEIEQLKFAVRVGVANSFRIFLRNISGEQSVRVLLAATQSRDIALQVLEKVIFLSNLRVDYRYLNRFDIPLATYLWILSRSFPDLAGAGAEACAKLPRTWWAEHVTNYILGHWERRSTTPTSASTVGGGFPNVNTSNVAAHTSKFFSESPNGFTSQVDFETTGTFSGTTDVSNASDEIETPVAFTTRNLQKNPTGSQ